MLYDGRENEGMGEGSLTSKSPFFTSFNVSLTQYSHDLTDVTAFN